MRPEQLKPNIILRGPLFHEPVLVLTTLPIGSAVKLIATGLISGQTYQPILKADQLAKLQASPQKEPSDGEQLNPNVALRGPLFPEPVQVILPVPMGKTVNLFGMGLKSGRTYLPSPNSDQQAKLQASLQKKCFDGEARLEGLVCGAGSLTTDLCRAGGQTSCWPAVS